MPPRATDREVQLELERIMHLIRASPQGLARPGIQAAYAAAYGVSLNERKVRRRLEALVANGTIVQQGDGKLTMYLAAPSAQAAATSVVDAESPGVATSPIPEIVLSPDAEEVRRLVRAVNRPPPLMATLTPYDQRLLRDYVPGETWYLDADQRAALLAIGRTPVAQQPAGTYAQEIYDKFLVDLSWSSSRLEGGGLTRIDTEQVFAQARRRGQAASTDEILVWNHKDAVDMLVNDAEAVGFDRPTFLGLHAELSHGLLKNPADEGRLRTGIVKVGDSWYKPLSIPPLIEELFNLLLQKAAAIPDPFEQAFFVMVHVPYLQPFIDVNKRVSRLGANLSLIRANLCPLSFNAVPRATYDEAVLAIYELQRLELLRDVFLWAYRNSCERYSTEREQRPKPDPIRTQYREELHRLVNAIVTGGTWPTDAELQQSVSALGVQQTHVRGVMDATRAILGDLHDGLLRRYALLPSQLAAWHAMLAAQTPAGGAQEPSPKVPE